MNTFSFPILKYLRYIMSSLTHTRHARHIFAIITLWGAYTANKRANRENRHHFGKAPPNCRHHHILAAYTSLHIIAKHCVCAKNLCSKP